MGLLYLSHIVWTYLGSGHAGYQVAVPLESTLKVCNETRQDATFGSATTLLGL